MTDTSDKNGLNNSTNFSVIMPVYNANKYIAKTLESILAQTYKSFELILIIDGSTDGSDFICEKYARLDKRITIIKQPNAGICNARNHGLRIAKGTFIAFCDHDDVYEPYYLETANNYIKKYPEVEIFKFTHGDENWSDSKLLSKSVVVLPNRNYTINQLFNSPDIFKRIVANVWNGVIKSDLLIKNACFFDEQYKFGLEDYAFNLTVFPKASFIFTASDYVYTHYNRYGQSTYAKFSKERMDNFLTIRQYTNEILSKIENVDNSTFFSFEVLFYSDYVNFLFAADCPYSDEQKMSCIERYKKELIRNNYVKFSTLVKSLYKQPKQVFKWFLLLGNKKLNYDILKRRYKK